MKDVNKENNLPEGFSETAFGRAVKVLGLSLSGGSDKNAVQVIATAFLYGSNLRIALKNHPFDSSVEQPVDSIGWAHGLRPEFIKISTTGFFSNEEAAELLGCPVVEWKVVDGRKKCLLTEEGKTVFRKSTRTRNGKKEWGVELLWPVLWPEDFRNKLVRNVLKALGRNPEELLPAHPAWANDNGGFVITVRKPGTPTLWEAFARYGFTKEELLGVFLRAGKDIWNLPLEKFLDVKLLVVPAPVSSKGNKSHDGNFVIATNAVTESWRDRSFLVRGVTKTKSGKLGVIKGRVMTSDGLLSEFGELPEGVHGWITPDNVKWSTVEPGEIITTKLAAVKEEGDEKEAYSLHILSLLIGKWEERSLKTITRMFERNAAKVSSRVADPFKNLLATITAMSDETEGKVRNSELCKAFYSLEAKSDRTKIWSTLVQKAKRIRVRGSMYPSLIFAEKIGDVDVMPGRPVANQKVMDDLLKMGKWNCPMTLVRYPITSHQSFLKVTIGSVSATLPNDHWLIVMHPDDAKFIQGDGDDHGLLLPGLVSAFDGNEEPLIGRGEILPMGDIVGLALKPWIAQSMIGPIFNALAKTIGALKKTEQLERIPGALKVLGGYLDIAAQGVKKNYALPNLRKIMDMVKTITDNLEADGDYLLALLATGKPKDDNELGVFNAQAQSHWNVDFGCFPAKGIREVATGEVSVTHLERLIKASVEVNNLAGAKRWMRTVQEAFAASFGFEGVTTLSGAIKEAMRTADPMAYEGKLLRVLHAYGLLAKEVAKLPNREFLLEVIDGVVLLAGDYAINTDMDNKT